MSFIESNYASNDNLCNHIINVTSTKNLPIVSIILTQSTKSELNINARLLKTKNSDTSAFCVLLDQFSDKKYYDKKCTKICKLNDNCGFYRFKSMSNTSESGLDDLSDDEAKKSRNEKKEKTSLGSNILNTKSLMDEATCSAWTNKCRICYGSVSNEELIRPCNCKGSVAYAHVSCLEHWLKESGRSYCELCNYNFTVIRKPKYGLLKSIIIWLLHPGEHHRAHLINDLISFILYTPAMICSTYILMLISENAARTAQDAGSTQPVNFITFFAIAGIAAIDFTYSSWLMVSLQKHIMAWKTWYRENSCLTLMLPPPKDSDSNRSQETGDENSGNISLILS